MLRSRSALRAHSGPCFAWSLEKDSYSLFSIFPEAPRRSPGGRLFLAPPGCLVTWVGDSGLGQIQGVLVGPSLEQAC